MTAVPAAVPAAAPAADPLPAWKIPDLPLVPGEPLWVFGYGSLMWNPGFPHIDRQPAVLHGFHRQFCIYSHRYRGTPERPGIVLGLDRGGSCRGIAFQVAGAEVPAVVQYLWDREMVTGVYRPGLHPIRIPQGRALACCFVADRTHQQYCGRLDDDRILAMLRDAVGLSGSNRDYLTATVAHLEELGIRDRGLRALARRMDRSSSGDPLSRTSNSRS